MYITGVIENFAKAYAEYSHTDNRIMDANVMALSAVKLSTLTYVFILAGYGLLTASITCVMEWIVYKLNT